MVIGERCIGRWVSYQTEISEIPPPRAPSPFSNIVKLPLMVTNHQTFSLAWYSRCRVRWPSGMRKGLLHYLVSVQCPLGAAKVSDAKDASGTSTSSSLPSLAVRLSTRTWG